MDLLQPDLLAERHVVNQLVKYKELSKTCFIDLSEARKVQALTVLARGCAHHDKAGGLLDELLHNNLAEFAAAAITVTLQTSPNLGDRLATAIHEAPVSDEALREIHTKIPYPTVALSATQLAVVQRIRQSLSPEADSVETAGWTADLAIALAQQGRVEEALKASTETVGIRRELAEARPDAFRPDLAASLTNQASFLAGLGRVEEALKASTEAVGFYRELAEARPDAFRLDLAASLTNQTLILRALERRDEALKTITEAIAVWRVLAARQPDLYQDRLNMVLALRDQLNDGE
ncbi:hypothetical protein GU90_01195 [Saccharopolyspora rectivirgula]|uniref:Tetratricopeptide repeat protein n=1 Tax=Saccharopolyspora rectivirgula TaxID=28042 RepID=A0A073B1F4_9PSEU|nr:hypothetical protein GU90_01195 [Saccharopolyspora rectivirgula]